MIISELIKQLELAKSYSGDVEVYLTSLDYPDKVKGVYLKTNNNDGYIPKGCVEIR